MDGSLMVPNKETEKQSLLSGSCWMTLTFSQNFTVQKFLILNHALYIVLTHCIDHPYFHW